MTTPIIPQFLLSPEAWVALGCLSVLVQLSATFGLSVAHGSFLTGLRVVSPTEDSLTAALNLKRKKQAKKTTTNSKKERSSGGSSNGKAKTAETNGKQASNGADNATHSAAPDEGKVGKNGTATAAGATITGNKKRQRKQNQKELQQRSSRPTDAATVGDRLATLEFKVARIRRGEMMVFSTDAGTVQTRTWNRFDMASTYVTCATVGWMSVWIGGLILRLCSAWGRDCDDYNEEAAWLEVVRRVHARRENALPVLTFVTVAAMYHSWSMGAVGAAGVHRRRLAGVGFGVASAVASLWLLHTPALLRALRLTSVTDGLEEMSARFLMLGRLVGVVRAREDEDDEALMTLLRVVSDGLRLALSVSCGLLAANMAGPIRSAAEVTTRAFQVGGGAEDVGGGLGASTGDDASSGISTTMNRVFLRIRILMLSILPLMHLMTYALPEHRLSLLLPGSSPSPRSIASVRIVLGWAFVLLSLSMIRLLLQTYLDEAVRDGAAELGVAGTANGGDPVGGRVRAGFHGRLQGLVGTAARYSSVPMFVASLLVMTHLRGRGSGSGGGTFPPASPGVPPSRLSSASTTVAGDGGAQLTEPTSDRDPPPLPVEAFIPTPIYDSCQDAVSSWTGGRACPSPPPPPAKLLDADDEDHKSGAARTLLISSSPPANSSTTLLGVLGDDLPYLASLASREPLARSVLLRGDGVRVEDAAVHEEDVATVREVTVRIGRVRAVFRSIFAHVDIFTPTIVSSLVEFVAFVLSVLWMMISYRCVVGALLGATRFGGGGRKGGAFEFHFADKEA